MAGYWPVCASCLDSTMWPSRIERALAGVTRGAKLASYLLAFSRRQALEPRVVRIDGLLGAMDDMLRRTLGAGIELETVQGGGLWLTHVDTNQLESAILNLALNARDAMDGGGTLTVRTWSDGACARIEIRISICFCRNSVERYVLLGFRNCCCIA